MSNARESSVVFLLFFENKRNTRFALFMAVELIKNINLHKDTYEITPKYHYGLKPMPKNI